MKGFCFPPPQNTGFANPPPPTTWFLAMLISTTMYCVLCTVQMHYSQSKSVVHLVGAYSKLLIGVGATPLRTPLPIVQLNPPLLPCFAWRCAEKGSSVCVQVRPSMSFGCPSDRVSEPDWYWPDPILEKNPVPHPHAQEKKRIRDAKVTALNFLSE